MGALAGIPVIGWAKPVPVNPNRLRNPRRDMLLVSLAGPATNLLLMLASAFVARCALPAARSASIFIDQLPLAVQIALAFAVVNLFLGAVQPAADPAARRRRAARARAAARVAAGLAPLPPVRDARALRARVLGRLPGHLFDPFLRHLYSYILR